MPFSHTARAQLLFGAARVGFRGSRAKATDWPQLAGLHAQLWRLYPSPVVAIDRAVAVGEPAPQPPRAELRDQRTGIDHAAAAGIDRRAVAHPLDR